MSKVYKIAVIGGDGTGPEVVAEGMKVIDVCAKRFGFKIESEDFDWGGDRYLKTGEIIPPGGIDELRKFDAIYLGAIGHPDVKPGILEKGILLTLRFELDQYIKATVYYCDYFKGLIRQLIEKATGQKITL